MSKFILGVDFDGTLVEHKYPKVGPVIPGAFEWLRHYQELGAHLILYTMRGCGRRGDFNPLKEALDLCSSHSVEFWQVNENKEQDDWTNSRKVYCHAYIDDASVGCPLVYPEYARPYVNWEVAGPMIKAMIDAKNSKFEDPREPLSHCQPAFG